MEEKREARGLLAAWLKVPVEVDDEFNDWYNTEHLLQISSVRGFLNGRRYKALGSDPWYLALYELESPDIIFGAEFQKVIAEPTPWSRRIRRFYGPNRVRSTYERMLCLGSSGQAPAPFLFMAKMDVQAEVEEEFNDWYSHEHIPALAGVPGVARVRRFVAVEGAPKYAATYEIESPEVLESDAWVRARELGRTVRMRTYMSGVEKACYKLVFSTDRAERR